MVLKETILSPCIRIKMDTIDQSYLEIENTVADCIVKNTGGLRNGGLVPNGICHNEDCEAEIAEKKLFCDGDCATEHHKASKRFGKR